MVFGLELEVPAQASAGCVATILFPPLQIRVVDITHSGISLWAHHWPKGGDA
jgi:hypothetical protein